MAQVTPSFEALFSISILVIVVALVARRLRVPYTVALVFAGLITPLYFTFPLPEITPEIFMALLLPPLVFEAAMRTDVHDLRKDADAILGFAFVGTLVSTVLVGMFANFLLGFSLLEAFLLGVIVSPTDPIACCSTFRRLGVPKRFSLMIEGESLFNDGVAIVLYSGIVTAFMTGIFEPLQIAQGITLSIIGGVLIGGFLGYIGYQVLWLSQDVSVDILLAFIVMYGVHQLADSLKTSGIIAVVVAGLVMIGYGRGKELSQESVATLETVWEFIAFLVTSVAFIFVGRYLELQLLWAHLWIVLPAIASILVARFLMIYLISTILYTWKTVIPGNWRDAIAWSGLRGPVSIVLVLGLRNLPSIEHAPEITAITFGVVLFSILVQGLSLNKIIQKLGIATETW